MSKHRWYYELGWAVEFVRKDAEIRWNPEPSYSSTEARDPDACQKVIGQSYDTRERAEQVAVAFCENLDKEIRAFVKEKLAHLKNAGP